MRIARTPWAVDMALTTPSQEACDGRSTWLRLHEAWSNGLQVLATPCDPQQRLIIGRWSWHKITSSRPVVHHCKCQLSEVLLCKCWRQLVYLCKWPLPEGCLCKCQRQRVRLDKCQLHDGAHLCKCQPRQTINSLKCLSPLPGGQTKAPR